MPYVSNASFTAYPREEVNRERVEEALQPLLGYLGTPLRERSKDEAVSNIWYDGTEVGCLISGQHSWDFQEAFEDACRQLGELTEEAFESTFTNDDAGSEDDRTSENVWGPTEASRRKLHLEKAICESNVAFSNLGLPRPAGLHPLQIAAADNVTVVMANGDGVGSVALTLDIAALTDAGFDPKQKDAIAQHVHNLACLMQEWAKVEIAVLARSDAKRQVELSDIDLARLALPTSRALEVCDGPTTGVGNEFHFGDRNQPTSRFYVCVDQGEVTACDEYEAETTQRSESPRG